MELGEMRESNSLDGMGEKADEVPISTTLSGLAV